MAYQKPEELKAWMIIDAINQTDEGISLGDLLITLQEDLPNQCQKCKDPETGIGQGRFLFTGADGVEKLIICDVCQGAGKTKFPVVSKSLGVVYSQQEDAPPEPPQAPLNEPMAPPEGI